MILTNTTELTIVQEEKCYQMVKDQFESKITDDYWHFSYEGNRLNLKSMRVQVVFEIHSEEGSFNGVVELNDKMNPLKSTVKFLKK